MSPSGEGDRIPRPTSPRIPLFAGEPSKSVADIIEASKVLGGDRPINIFTTMAHNGRAMKHVFNLGGAFMFAGNISDRAREIVIVRVARNTRCEYEYAQHLVIAQRCGLTRAEVEALVAPGADPAGDFTPVERAIVALVDELCADDTVTDATWATLSAEHDHRAMAELLLVAGYYRMLAGFLNGAGVPLDPGLEGFPAGAGLR